MNEKHWDGNKNRAIRWYFYSQRGLQLFNEFRYLFMLIFGLYMLMKLQNPLWLLVMFMVSMPALIFTGWLQVHHMAPIINWLDITYGSYWSKKSMEWQEDQVNAVKEIRDAVVNPLRSKRGKIKIDWLMVEIVILLFLCIFVIPLVAALLGIV